MRRTKQNATTLTLIFMALFALGAAVTVAVQAGESPAYVLTVVTRLLGQTGISTRDLIAAGVGATIALMIKGQR